MHVIRDTFEEIVCYFFYYFLMFDVNARLSFIHLNFIQEKRIKKKKNTHDSGSGDGDGDRLMESAELIVFVLLLSKLSGCLLS